MRRPVLGPAAASVSWLVVLVVLNLTGDPLVCGATWLALAVLALRTSQRRLVVLSLVVGAGLLLVVPGVAWIDGSFELRYPGGALPSSTTGWLAAIGAGLRVPAQVLAAAYLVLVPARLLLDAAARYSPDTAVLGALAARMHPLLERDVRLVRDELASRGLRFGGDAPIGVRLRAAGVLWEAVVSGILDRAFVTAAALETRGWGAARPTGGALRHPELRDPVPRGQGTERALLVLGVAAVATTIAAKGAGQLVGPVASSTMVAGTIATPGAVVVASLLVASALLAARPARHGADGASAPSARRAQEAGGSGGAAPLHVERVSMRYPGAAAESLVDASLVVEPGELVVVFGPSGGGKSTLLDVVSGSAPRTTGGERSGTVRLGEHVLGLVRDSDRGRIASVFQDPETQVLVGVVAEEVAFALRQAGRPIDQLEATVLAVLDELGIRHLARRDCGTLSGGELQRVLLAAALAADPAVLVLDEPTSQVDAATERRFWDAVDRARRERGIGVLAAEHRLDALVDRADRFVHVAGGRIVAQLTPAELAEQRHALLGDPYAGLVPAPVAPNAPARVVVRVDRLDVEDRSAPGSARSLLRNVAFSLPAGSIVTLEGPNGTGKSTLLRAIRGLHPGALLQVDGHVRRSVGGSAGLVSWLSQGAGSMLPGRSVRACAIEPGVRLGIGTAYADAALDAAGLRDRADSHPSELSVGERQRLALVVATSHRPPLWLLDEPTRGMDPVALRWVAAHVLAHAAGGGVVLVATHDPQLAAAIATHRLRLDSRSGPQLLPVQRDPGGHPQRVGTGEPHAGPRTDHVDAEVDA